MNKTGIDYLDMTWNPTTGCSPVSAGCDRCWAAAITERFKDQWGYDFTPTCHPDRLLEPLSRKKPTRIGVSFMGDLFHKDIPDEFIDQVFAVMAACPQHTFQLLTKRLERTARFSSGDQRRIQALAYGLNDLRCQFARIPKGMATWPLPNVWLGTSIEDQATADERIPHLLRCPATLRYVSVEPLLDWVELYQVYVGDHITHWVLNALTGEVFDAYTGEHPARPGELYGKSIVGLPVCGSAQQRPLDWVICGCESGPGARPMDIDWVRSLRDQCQQAGVPFFLKQMMVNGKLEHMPKLDGRVHDEYPKEDDDGN